MSTTQRDRPIATNDGAANVSAGNLNDTARIADLDAMAEHLRGYFVVQVAIDNAGHRRTSVYRSAAAAERCVKRANERGRRAHVTLCQLLPVGVVAVLGGDLP